MFIDKPIQGVILRELKKHPDSRGWLCELFRMDQLSDEFRPEMAYISMSHPGICRGPHEHRDQADFFCFIGPSEFKVYLWDHRPASPTYMHRMTITGGEQRPLSIVIPAGIVHAYRNIGNETGMVVNCPNRLFAGRDGKEPVDEIRHEDDPNTIYLLD